MLKHKTADLEGPLLDAAVAKAEGMEFVVEQRMTNPPKPIACWPAKNARPTFGDGPFSPSTDWRHGGPIIERERITVMAHGRAWEAFYGLYYGPGDDLSDGNEIGITGDTYLIAAMRAYVASKFGEEVELP